MTRAPRISWGSVAVCLAQFVSQSGPLVYLTPPLIRSAPTNTSDQCVIHDHIIAYCMRMSWEMPPLPFLFSRRGLYWKASGHGQIVLLWGWWCGELFGLLTWMNCWSNVEAGNSWIVYINMINIALINHLSVIYCCFSHLALTRKLWRISPWSPQKVLGPSAGWWSYRAPTLWVLMFPYGSLLVPVWFCINRWEKGGEHNHVCARTDATAQIGLFCKGPSGCVFVLFGVIPVMPTLFCDLFFPLKIQ